MAGKSIVIVGAGVVGLVAALELRTRGWEVTVLDQGRVPHPDAASTDISKVIRMDYGTDELYLEMGERAVDGWEKWNREWDRVFFHADGFLLMTRDETMPAESFEAASFAALTKRGHPLRRVRRADLARDFPEWNAAGYGDGYFNPRAGWAESGAVVAHLAGLATVRGVALHENAPFGGFLGDGPAVRGVRTTAGAEYRAGHVLLAVGAWTAFLLPELGGLLRATGQAVVQLKPADPQRFLAPRFPVWAADIARTGWYGFPANADGLVKIGHHGSGTAVRSPAQKRVVTAAEVAECRDFLRHTFPALAAAPLAATRQCWYGDSADGHFLIDHHPHRPGLIVTGGDSGHGFKFAPVLGGLIADVTEKKENPWAARFRWREQVRPEKEQSRSEV
ncbi:MAG: FAD-dependent oxidoreductase [Opitutae bacterium]|nr:FAD-dependent oxidoreductase [Opitutae bacterium]